MEEKEDKKKGFFASLFAPKPCKCSCGVQIEEVEERLFCLSICSETL